MARRTERPLRDVLRDARMTLGMTQAEFGPALGWSHRSAVRWERGRSVPLDDSLVKLASLLVPVDADLAAEVATAVGATLESLGLAQPQVPEKPGTRCKPDDLADAVVCAVADATDLLPRALRPLLHAAFARARALGLTVEQLEESLRPRVEAAKNGERKERVRLRVRVEEEPEREELDTEPPVERRGRARASK
jgi:transcriptional regulator with XRE-family HTH domain